MTSLKNIIVTVDKSRAAQIIRRVFSSYYFPFITAIVVGGCFCLGWDIVTAWYVCLCGAAILIFCRDATPVVGILLLVQIMVSVQNSPHELASASNYYFTPAHLAQEIICVILFGSAVIARTVTGIVRGRFKPTPLFWGLVVLGVAFMLSGVFYSHYTAKNLLYGAILAAILLFVFVFVSGNVGAGERTYMQIACYAISLFTALAIELIYIYCTTEGLIVGGMVQRRKLFFGWGTYNSCGMLLTLSVPAWYYLAIKTKFGFLGLFGAAVNVIACFFSMSRQSMVVSLAMALACTVWLMIACKGKRRIICAAVIGALLVVAAVVLSVLSAKIKVFFDMLFGSISTGGGRTPLWNTSIRNFLRKPLFGIGFFDPLAPPKDVGHADPGFTSLIPWLSHNTVFQLMSACGLTGLLVYCVHRAQTVISLLDDFNCGRLLIAFIISCFLLCCLLDVYIFDLFHTIMYSLLVALLSATGGRKDKAKKFNAVNLR